MPSRPAALILSSARVFCSMDSVRLSTRQPYVRAACGVGCTFSVLEDVPNTRFSHLNGQAAPSRSELEHTLPWAKPGLLKDVANFAHLRKLQIVWS